MAAFWGHDDGGNILAARVADGQGHTGPCPGLAHLKKGAVPRADGKAAHPRQALLQPFKVRPDGGHLFQPQAEGGDVFHILPDVSRKLRGRAFDHGFLKSDEGPAQQEKEGELADEERDDKAPRAAQPGKGWLPVEHDQQRQQAAGRRRPAEEGEEVRRGRAPQAGGKLSLVHAEEHAAHFLVQSIPDGVVQPDDPVLRKFLHLMAHAFPPGRDVRPVAGHIPRGHGLALGVLHQQPSGPRGPAEGGDAFPEMFEAVRLLAETCQT